jgi:hypothetical protein
MRCFGARRVHQPGMLSDMNRNGVRLKSECCPAGIGISVRQPFNADLGIIRYSAKAVGIRRQPGKREMEPVIEMKEEPMN